MHTSRRVGGLTAKAVRSCREQALRAAGFHDIFRPIKDRENEGALALLAGVCEVGALRAAPAPCSAGGHARADPLRFRSWWPGSRP